ncbi:MAG: hypothetical protein ACTSW0_04235 [Candidatus Heimdallarchaeota archaeon]
MSTCPKCKSAAIYDPAHVQTPNGLLHITVPNPAFLSLMHQ